MLFHDKIAVFNTFYTFTPLYNKEINDFAMSNVQFCALVN